MLVPVEEECSKGSSLRNQWSKHEAKEIIPLCLIKSRKRSFLIIKGKEYLETDIDLILHSLKKVSIS